PYAHNALGLVQRDQGRRDEAWQCFARALALQPNNAEAHTNQAMLLLEGGDFDRGWSEYEWRWKISQMPQRQFDKPHWDGRALQGQTILLHAEQGLGDTLQFIRYASLIKQLGATVIAECPAVLTRLLKTCPG